MGEWNEQTGTSMDAIPGVPDWLKRLVGGARGPAPTPAATPPVTLGGGAAPQPPPVKSSEMSTTPVKAPPVSYASQAAQMAGQEPQRDQFQAKPIGVGRNLLGIAGSILQGLQNPANAGAAEKQFLAGPKQKADDEYNQAHQQWVGKMAQIANQANLAKSDAEIGEKQAQEQNLQSETRARDNKPDPTVKPGTPQEQAFEAYIKQGMDPTKAYRQVIQDAQDAKPDKQPDDKQRDIADYMAANKLQDTPANRERARDAIARRTPAATVSVQNANGPSSTLAQAVASGNMKIGDVLTARMPLTVRQKFLNEVLQINPQFKSFDYDVEKGVARDFTSGKSAQNLTAFNTAIEHATQAQEAAKAMGNGDIKTLNKIGNALGVELGKDQVTNFNVIKSALSGEISKVFKGGQATDAEIKEVQGPFDAAGSPKQLEEALKTAVRLMNSKRDALKKQYEAGQKGTPNFGDGGGSGTTWNPKTGRYE